MFSKHIDEFWISEFFQCTKEEFYSGNDIVLPHKYWVNYNGAFIMKISNKYIFSVADKYISIFNQVANNDFNLYNEEAIKKELKNLNIKYIGPAWIGYLVNEIKSEIPDTIKVLDLSKEENQILLNELKDKCDEIEWSHSGIDNKSELVVVQYYENKIVAAADYHMWGKNIAHIGVITNPEYRGKGFAKNVIAGVSKEIFLKGLIPQYRTLSSNIGAIKAAEACGFKQYAVHISLRFN